MKIRFAIFSASYCINADGKCSYTDWLTIKSGLWSDDFTDAALFDSEADVEKRLIEEKSINDFSVVKVFFYDTKDQEHKQQNINLS